MNSHSTQRKSNNFKANSKVIKAVNVGPNRDILLTTRIEDEQLVLVLMQRLDMSGVTNIHLSPQHRDLLKITPDGLLMLIEMLSSDEVYDKIVALSHGQDIETSYEIQR